MDKLICVGKNYLEHAKELGDAVPEMPVLFLKPESSLVVADASQATALPFPRNKGSLHHECEIVVRLGDHGTIDAVTLGLDMTLRDLQSTLKKNGHPWEVSKVFAGAAVVGKFISISDFKDYADTEFSLEIDGKVRQAGNAKQMRLSVEECIEYAKGFFPLCKGDLIFTGTPAGVGPVEIGSTGTLRWGKHIQYQVKWE